MSLGVFSHTSTMKGGKLFDEISRRKVNVQTVQPWPPRPLPKPPFSHILLAFFARNTDSEDGILEEDRVVGRNPHQDITGLRHISATFLILFANLVIVDEMVETQLILFEFWLGKFGALSRYVGPSLILLNTDVMKSIYNDIRMFSNGPKWYLLSLVPGGITMVEFGENCMEVAINQVFAKMSQVYSVYWVFYSIVGDTPTLCFLHAIVVENCGRIFSVGSGLMQKGRPDGQTFNDRMVGKKETQIGNSNIDTAQCVKLQLVHFIDIGVSTQINLTIMWLLFDLVFLGKLEVPQDIMFGSLAIHLDVIQCFSLAMFLGVDECERTHISNLLELFSGSKLLTAVKHV